MDYKAFLDGVDKKYEDWLDGAVLQIGHLGPWQPATVRQDEDTWLPTCYHAGNGFTRYGRPCPNVDKAVAESYELSKRYNRLDWLTEALKIGRVI